MTTTARSLARLLAIGIAVALPAFAYAASASASTIALGDRENYALLAAGLGMVVFMTRRGGRR